MRRPILILAIALAAQLLLAGALSLRGNPLTGEPPSSALLPSTIMSADHVLIQTGSATGQAATPGRLELVKKNGVWTLPGDFGAPVAAGRVSTLLGRLAALKRGLPVGTTAAAPRRFKVADHDYVRRIVVSLRGKVISTLYLGSSPGVRQSDARVGGQRAVYAVDLPTYEMPTSTDEWFNSEVLERQPQTVSRIAISRSGRTLQLVHTIAPAAAAKPAKKAAARASVRAHTRAVAARTPKPEWSSPSLAKGRRVNSKQAGQLLTTIADLDVDSVLGIEPKPEWRQDHPVLTLQITNDKGGTETWTLSKAEKGGQMVLKSSAHPWYFAISAGTAKELTDSSAFKALITRAGKPAR